ncbi:MAG: O-antigen polymerase [Terracidiphilus sp.]|jgi:hypothetical protein
MTHSLTVAIAIDLTTVALCALVAFKVARSLLHPAAMFLVCHCYIVTVRLFQLKSGMRPMTYSFEWPVTVGEVVRAAIASDIALVAMALGWLAARYWGERRVVANEQPKIMLSKARLQFAGILAIVLSCIAIMLVGPAGLRDERLVAGTAESSGYLLAAAGWTGWGFCLLHYIYGFPPLLLATTVSVLFASMMFSAFRGIVIIPLVFLIILFLARRQQKRFPVGLLIAAPLLWIIWLPMKPIFYSLQQGDQVDVAMEKGIDTAFHNFGRENGSGIDFQFLDMIGSTMTLVDLHGQHLWGASVAPLFVSPIPRLIWPDKPPLNQYQEELDIPSRAMAKLNMTAGLVGECYADFGWAGIVLIPLLISVAFTTSYLRLSGTNIFSPGCLLYLIFLSTFMQLYRDGLVSAVWFPFVHCAPVGWLAVSHWLFPPRDWQVHKEPELVQSYSITGRT